MAEDYKTFQGAQLVKLLAANPLPTVKGWNRLEGRPRTEEFDKTLRAEVRDPLWMLTRQWQVGEFLANDAGSPVFARAKVATTRLDRYQVKDAEPQSYDEAIPLEARAEQERVRFGLMLGLQISRYWLRLLEEAHAEGVLSQDYRPAFRAAYPIPLPPRDADNGDVYAHQEAWQLHAATAGRSMNGAELYQDMLHGRDILANVTLGSQDDLAPIRGLEEQLVAWIRRQYGEPGQDEESAWAPSYLEYQFSCSAPDYDGEGQIVLIADEYPGGHLDWYSFDIHPDVSAIEPPEIETEAAFEPPEERTFDFIPAAIEFGGMPNARWWEFEDRKTYFGDVDVHTTDLAKLLLIEFGLIYANDWFLVPFELPVGSLAKVEGLAVTNVFGERIWIEAAGEASGDDWQRWAMYNLNTRGVGGAADRSIFLPPTLDRVQESGPLEEVRMVRDEIANMVWGVESQILLSSGETRDGHEVATELVNYLTSLLDVSDTEEAEVPNEAKIRYRLMTSVPENWIPFIPVRLPENNGINREIQLQRAAMLRILPGSTDRPKIRPRTEILRHNIEGSYFVHEEEVLPQAGVEISTSFQRARWHDGMVCVWAGRRKRRERDARSSGLAFDQIEPTGQGGA